MRDASPATDVRDFYGFRLSCTVAEKETRVECEQRQAHQLQAWEKYWKKRKMPTGEKLKKLCRKGVPLELRPWVWMEMSDARQKKNSLISGYFDAMLQRGEVSSECAHQIELVRIASHQLLTMDLPRTFPSNQWVSTEEGQAALGRVLLAFSVHKPCIGYCQSMNYIAAMLLLALERDEENAFWLLISLIDDGGILYHDMYTSNLVGAHVEMQSLEELVAAKLPKLAAHLRQLNCDMTIIATDWFLCLFCTALPSETAARVWDSLLEEGTKILYRVALALLKLNEAELLQRDNAGDLINHLRHCTQQMHDRDRLMKVAFDGIGSMPMQKIREVRRAKQVVVDSEMQKRECREQLRRTLSINRISNNTHASPINGLAGFAERLGLRHASWTSGGQGTANGTEEPAGST